MQKKLLGVIGITICALVLIGFFGYSVYDSYFAVTDDSQIIVLVGSNAVVSEIFFEALFAYEGPEITFAQFETETDYRFGADQIILDYGENALFIFIEDVSIQSATPILGAKLDFTNLGRDEAIILQRSHEVLSQVAECQTTLYDCFSQ